MFHLIDSENPVDFVYHPGIYIQTGFRWEAPVKQQFFTLFLEEKGERCSPLSVNKTSVRKKGISSGSQPKVPFPCVPSQNGPGANYGTSVHWLKEQRAEDKRLQLWLSRNRRSILYAPTTLWSKMKKNTQKVCQMLQIIWEGSREINLGGIIV